MLDEATREAIASQAKADARRAGLSGDAFWSFVWRRVEGAMLEAGMIPRPSSPPSAVGRVSV